MSALIQLLDRPIAYQPSFAQLRVGKVKAGPAAAVLLSQFVYWHNRMEGSWIYKTQVEIKSETGLSRDEQETARKRLVALGVVEEELRGVPATLHYRVDAERLEALLLTATQQTRQIAATPQTRLRHSPKPDCGNCPNKNAASPQTSLLEPTQQACGDPANFLSGDYTESTQRDCQADELLDDPALRVLNHLNLTTGAKFKDGKTTLGFINGLLSGEYVADELILVIDYLDARWRGEAKMEQYLRPSTMFRLENFEEYLPLARKWEGNGRPALRAAEPAIIDTGERDMAYKRFLGQVLHSIPKTALEISVRKSASLAGVKEQVPDISKRTWDRIWVEQVARFKASVSINIPITEPRK